MGQELQEITESIKSALGQIRLWALKHRFVLKTTCGAGLILLATIAILQMYASYRYYDEFIESRINQQSFQRPPGVYAAPQQIQKGQNLSIGQLIQRLSRAGYAEDDQASTIGVGNFRARENQIEFHTNPYALTEDLPQSIRITLNRKKDGRDIIETIKNAEGDRELKMIKLPAALITTDLNNKTQAQSYLEYGDFPAVLVKALTAIEDRQFFTHSGFDVRGLCRAFFSNWRSGGIRQGGSTITQQLIKMRFLSPERTYERKYAEFMMSMALERRLNKQQIFSLYANRVYLGQSGPIAIYGFMQAARIYFGKEVKELSLAEAALLSGIIQAPNRYSPYLRQEGAIARRNLVLDAMQKTGAISEQEAAAAKSETLALLPPAKFDDEAAPHFVDYVKRQIEEKNAGGLDQTQLRIETSLDPDLQEAANQAVAEYLPKLDKRVEKRNKGARPEVALLAIDPHSGEILAMVGGRNYSASQLNRVIDAHRQPGSIFKPIVYASALSSGMTPATTFEDKPQDFAYSTNAVYSPQNFHQSYSNQTVMLREGIVRSLNVVTVNAALQVGLTSVSNMAVRAGLPRPDPYPSLALGASVATPLEIARAYSVFANEGVGVRPFAIKAIKSGDALIDEISPEKNRVMASTTAYLVTDALADVINRGTGARIRQLGLRGPMAGKTGSSRDAWFAGYTPNLLVVVWVGFDDYQDLGLTGGEAAAPIWADFIKRALVIRPDLVASRFKQPEGLETVEIDPDTGTIAGEYCPRRQRVLIEQYTRPNNCFEHVTPVLDEPLPVEGLLAPSAENDQTQILQLTRELTGIQRVSSAPPNP